jgi:hypothetical protein
MILNAGKVGKFKNSYNVGIFMKSESVILVTMALDEGASIFQYQSSTLLTVTSRLSASYILGSYNFIFLLSLQ